MISERLADQRVAILGLGLMGGSLAMALRGRCAELLGIDPDPLARALAEQRGLVERLSADPAKLLPEATLVVLAAPVRAIIGLINDLPHLHPAGAIVLDLGSTKAEIAMAMQSLPRRFEPVGGHPMCGKVESSAVYAQADLYQEAPFVLCELPNSSLRACRLAQALVEAIGARPVWLEPERHDQWVAHTSHLPYLLANALAFTTPPQAAALVGPGFRSAARLAPASQRMMLDILITNQPNILASLRACRLHLEILEEALTAGDYAHLQNLLGQGAYAFEALTGARDDDER